MCYIMYSEWLRAVGWMNFSPPVTDERTKDLSSLRASECQKWDDGWFPAKLAVRADSWTDSQQRVASGPSQRNAAPHMSAQTHSPFNTSHTLSLVTFNPTPVLFADRWLVPSHVFREMFMWTVVWWGTQTLVCTVMNNRKNKKLSTFASWISVKQSNCGSVKVKSNL